MIQNPLIKQGNNVNIQNTILIKINNYFSEININVR